MRNSSIRSWSMIVSAPRYPSTSTLWSSTLWSSNLWSSKIENPPPGQTRRWARVGAPVRVYCKTKKSGVTWYYGKHLNGGIKGWVDYRAFEDLGT
ncbi:hypothetical protein [Streptomyces sp. NPDC029674]|uniref:hypothetical protein n=1 Tax=Streptomyces sp. NPDC029674 TaxID=3365297 RepID=UPI00384C12C6